MEHSSKRRRIVRKVEQILGDRSTNLEGQHARLSRNLVRKEGYASPKLVLPPSADAILQVEATLHQDDKTSFSSTERSDLAPPRLEFRQRLPRQVTNDAKPVEPITNRAAEMARPSAIVGSDNPGETGGMQKSVPAGQKVSTKQAESTDLDTPKEDDNTSHPVDDVPGLVTPLPAEAAASARNEALQSQEAGANGYDHGAAQSAGEHALSAIGNQPEQTQNVLSSNVMGTSSQHVLGPPSTPVPSSLEPTLASTSYFETPTPTSHEQYPTQHSLNPTTAPHVMSRVHDAQPSFTHNSTMSVSTSARSSTSSTSAFGSFSNAKSTSKAAKSRHSLTASLSNSITSSTFTALPSDRGSVSASPSFISKMSPSSRSISSRAPSISFTALSSSSSSLTMSASSSNVVGGAGNGNNGSPAPTQSPTSTPSAISGGGGAPPTPVLVGGIVGGVAGLVMILLALIFLLRWRRGKMGQRRLISPPMEQSTIPANVAQSGTGTQRSSNVPIAAAGFFGRLRPSSSQTAATTDTAPSERGFQKISGRKLDSVLQTGGDGYGNMPSGPSGGISAGASRGVAPGQGPYAGLAPGLRPSPPQSLSGSSFYRDSRGFYGGVVPKDESSLDPTDPSISPSSSSTPNFPPPPTGVLRSPHGPSRGSEVANIRPGPARQPVINEPGFLPARNPSRVQGPPPRPVRATPPPIMEHPRDGLGRSHASQDGSRSSRFVEATTPP